MRPERLSTERVRLCQHVLSAVRAGDQKMPKHHGQARAAFAPGERGHFAQITKEKPADQSQRAISLVLTPGFQGLAPANNRRPNQPGAPALKKVILACQKIRCSELATAIKIHYFIRPLPFTRLGAGFLLSNRNRIQTAKLIGSSVRVALALVLRRRTFLKNQTPSG